MADSLTLKQAQAGALGGPTERWEGGGEGGNFVATPQTWQAGTYTGSDGQQYSDDLGNYITNGDGTGALMAGTSGNTSSDQAGYDAYQRSLAQKAGLDPSGKYVIGHRELADGIKASTIYKIDPTTGAATPVKEQQYKPQSMWTSFWRPAMIGSAGVIGASLGIAGAYGALGAGVSGVDGAGGMALQEGGLPASLSGSASAGAEAGAAGSAATSGSWQQTFSQLAQKYGTKAAGALMSQMTSSGGGSANNGGSNGTGGSMNPDGSLNWGQIIGAAGSLYSAAQADKIGGAITDAGTAALARQSANATSAASMAQQAWEQQRNTWNPAQLDAAKANAAVDASTAAKQGANADYYSGLTKDFVDQGKKSWKYQDMAMQTADDYASGKMANTMADEANADVNQKYAAADASMQRNAAKYGINPGSGAFAGAMGDMYNQKALAGAGAQTAARRAARDKAEQMVATAAGAGQASFGNGLQAGGLATGAANSAVNASQQGVQGWSTANNAVANGNNSVNYGMNSATSANNSVGTIGRDLSAVNAGSRVGNLVGGTGSGWAKIGSGISTAIGGALGGDGVTAAPSYAAGGGDGGFGGSFDAWNSGVIPD